MAAKDLNYETALAASTVNGTPVLRPSRTAWVHEQRAGIIGSVLAVAGGVVFTGDVDRRFIALDDARGNVLWETVLSGPVSGHAISYAVNGHQYVAIPTGGDTASPEKRVLSLHPEIKPPQGQNAIFVFALSPSAERGTSAGAVPWGVAGLVAGLLAGIAVSRRRGRGADAAGAAAAPRRDRPTIESKESQ